jgi:hypothetical protein
MLDTLEQIVNYDKVISSTVALTGATSAMCGAIGSINHTSGMVCAANTVATLAGVGGSVLIGTHIIKEHLGGNKDLNQLYGLMAVPVLAVGAVRLASSFVDDTSSGSTATNGVQNSGEDLSDKIDDALEIIKAVKTVYNATDVSGNILALEQLALVIDDCDCITVLVNEIKDGKYTKEEVGVKAKVAAKDEAIDAIDDVLYEIEEFDENKTKDIKPLIEEVEDLVAAMNWDEAITKLEKAYELAENM